MPKFRAIGKIYETWPMNHEETPFDIEFEGSEIGFHKMLMDFYLEKKAPYYNTRPGSPNSISFSFDFVGEVAQDLTNTGFINFEKETGFQDKFYEAYKVHQSRMELKKEEEKRKYEAEQEAKEKAEFERLQAKFGG